METIQRPKRAPANPTISIIIPTYQHAEDIAACIHSIFGQTYTDYEIIVVDDGSTDNTQEVLKPFLDRITLITQDNLGGNAARNRGFRESTGKYLLFCDADLILNNDCLEKMLRTLEAHPEASYVYPAFRFGWKTFKFWNFDAETLRRLNYIHTSSLLRREHFPGFDESIRKFQDWDLWLTMLEQGHTGIYLSEVVFLAIPHKGGISVWVPRFFYKVPWKKFGWRVMSVEKYEHAGAIIREKHNLPKSIPESEQVWQMYWKALAALGVFEVISFVGFLNPMFGQLCAIAGLLAVAVLAWRSLPAAMLVVLADLFVGSQGGAMLSLTVTDGLIISARMGLFFVIGTVFSIKTALALLRRNAQQLAWWHTLREQKLFWPYLALLVAIIYAAVRGVMLGNGFGQVFFDANGYLYFLLLPPLLAAFLEQPKAMAINARALLFAGMTTISLKALAVLYVFSHRMQGLMVPMYAWIRDTRVGEITRMGETDFYRVFFQSHLFLAMLYLGILLWMAAVATRRDGGLRRTSALLGILMASIILGLSRSFWFGMICGVITGAVLLLWSRAPQYLWKRMIAYGIATTVLGVLLVITAYALPSAGRTGDFAFFGVFGDRATSLTGEAALNSRRALLPEVWKTGLQHPVLGSGFGKAVTYVTSDPRILAYIPNGVYSTIAFEWGYHDLWIKLGLIGTAIYAWFVYAVLRPCIVALKQQKNALREGRLNETREWVVNAAILIGVVVMLGTHVFSPYLNHPLGIGTLLLIAAWKSQKQSSR